MSSQLRTISTSLTYLDMTLEKASGAIVPADANTLTQALESVAAGGSPAEADLAEEPAATEADLAEQPPASEAEDAGEPPSAP